MSCRRRPSPGAWTLVALVGLIGPALAQPDDGLGPDTTDYEALVKRARRVKGIAYVDSRAYTCGGQTFGIARFQHKASGLVLHLVPGGSFRRGSPETEFGRDTDESPAAVVTLPPFLIAATECPLEAWTRVMGAAPRAARGPRAATMPVSGVTWDDVQGFCKKAGLRLPSEAEWEYACRAGTRTAYCFGDDPLELERYGAYAGNSRGRGAREVGTMLPNAFGLHDVHANLLEWVQDSYVYGYKDAPLDGSAFEKPGTRNRVIRGGSCGSDATWCRSASRGMLAQDGQNVFTTFRPALSLP